MDLEQELGTRRDLLHSAGLPDRLIHAWSISSQQGPTLFLASSITTAAIAAAGKLTPIIVHRCIRLGADEETLLVADRVLLHLSPSLFDLFLGELRFSTALLL